MTTILAMDKTTLTNHKHAFAEGFKSAARRGILAPDELNVLFTALLTSDVPEIATALRDPRVPLCGIYYGPDDYPSDDLRGGFYRDEMGNHVEAPRARYALTDDFDVRFVTVIPPLEDGETEERPQVYIALEPKTSRT